MVQPIVLPRKRTPFENPLLQSVFLTTIQEGLRRKREGRKNERIDTLTAAAQTSANLQEADRRRFELAKGNYTDQPKFDGQKPTKFTIGNETVDLYGPRKTRIPVTPEEIEADNQRKIDLAIAKKAPPSIQRKTRYFKKDGKIFAQEYNFNPRSELETSVGPPYESKQPGGTEIKMSTGGEREAVAKGQASLDLLDNLQGLFDSTYVGQVVGRVAKVKDLWGGNPKAQSEFNAATATLKNQVIKEITGAQMSEVEAARIMKQVPDVTDHPKVWQAKWRQTRKNLFNIQKRRLEVMERSGVRVPKEPVENQEDPLGIRGGR